MFSKIKNKVEQELPKFLRDIDKCYSLSKLSPVLFKNIQEFVLRDGKRIRPVLFIIGYLGFRKNAAAGLYTSALSLELLHDFMLVHDDIIDKSATRRGKPSLHIKLERYLKGFSKIKFNGQDLAIVIGDVMYAAGIHAFLCVQENQAAKERALKKFIEAAVHTGVGEFIELLAGAKDISAIRKEEIYRIYDYKTASYSFASPLASGAILAGASNQEADKLFKYGIYLGRAFQIKDDILGTFGNESKIGKSTLTDLKEAKKTILIWYAFRQADKRDKSLIRKILAKNNAGKKDLLAIRRIILETAALNYAQDQISSLIKKAEELILSSSMHRKYCQALHSYTCGLLKA